MKRTLALIAVGGDLHAILAAEPYPADFDQVRDINHQDNSRAISGAVSPR